MQAATESLAQVVRGNEMPTFNVFGVLIQFLIPPTQEGELVNMMDSRLGPGTIVPLHSHVDPEIFYILEGSLEIYRSGGGFEGWATANAGDSFLVPSGIKHAVRNQSSAPARALAVSRGNLYEFFQKLGVRVNPSEAPAPPAPPTLEQMERLFALAQQYQYWMASPEENASIGISLLG